jgi:transcriptional regulator GlxA family with amidase domain
MTAVLLTASAEIPSKLSGIEKSADAYLLISFDKLEMQAIFKNLIISRQKLQENYASVTLPVIKDRTEASLLNNRFIQKMLTLMDSNIDNDEFGISQLCDALGMSRAQIYRKFKALTNITLHYYLRSFRLQRAKELLLTTKLNVSEVSYRTGFKNVSHFSRIFVKEFSKHPSDFRR